MEYASAYCQEEVLWLTPANMGCFEEAYFQKNYVNYYRQNPVRKLMFYRTLVESVVQGIERPRLLDVGCALGLFLGVLNPEWELFGVDVSNFGIQKAKEAIPHARLEVWDGTQVPFKERFDVIVSFDVLEHVPDVNSLASTIYSRLAWDGHFIFVVPVYDGPAGHAVRLLDRDQTHIHKKGRNFWLEWTRGRFTLVDWCGIYRLLIGGLYYVHIPSRRLRRFAPTIAVTAQKRKVQ